MELLRRTGEHGVYGPAGIVALSAGGLKWLILPSFVRRISIAADNDADGLGQSDALHAATRWSREGRQVKFKAPARAGEDWNDVLRRIVAAELEAGVSHMTKLRLVTTGEGGEDNEPERIYCDDNADAIANKYL
jgi:hypothetical protein